MSVAARVWRAVCCGGTAVRTQGGWADGVRPGLLRVAGLRAVVVRAPDLRTVRFLAAVLRAGLLRAAVLRAVVFLAAVLRAAVLRAGLLRAAVFFTTRSLAAV